MKILKWKITSHNMILNATLINRNFKIIQFPPKIFFLQNLGKVTVTDKSTLGNSPEAPTIYQSKTISW